MNTATRTIIKAIELACSLAGRDVHVQRDAPGASLWDFARSEPSAKGCREYWGLGFHAAVSRKA